MIIKTMKLFVELDELYPFYTLEDKSYYPNDKPIEVTENFYREYKLAMENFFYYQNKIQELGKETNPK